jgi:DHA1 family tetracycline resistance protein-like MFS transporter
MPFYVEEFDDAQEMGIGAATSVLVVSYTIGQFLATPLFGMASDRVGRRPMLLLSLLGGSVGFLAQAFANSLWVLGALRFLTGLFGGSRPVAFAWIGDAVPPEKQPKYTAGISGIISVSLLVAPVFGGSMGTVSLRLPCLFQAGLGLIVLFVAFWHLEEPEVPEERQFQAKGGDKQVAPEPSVHRWKLLLVCNTLVACLASGVISSWMTMLPIIASQDVGLRQNEIGLIGGLAGLALAGMQFGVFVPLSRRVRLPLLGSAGMVLLSAPSLLLLTGNGIWQLVCLTFLHAAGAGLITGGVSIVVNMLAPPHLRGTAMALMVSAQAGSRVLFPLLAGPMYDAAEWAPLALIAGAGLTATAIELALTPYVGRLPRPSGPTRETSGERLTDAKGLANAGVRERPVDSSTNRLPPRRRSRRSSEPEASELELLRERSVSETQAESQGLRSNSVPAGPTREPSVERPTVYYSEQTANRPHPRRRSKRSSEPDASELELLRSVSETQVVLQGLRSNSVRDELSSQLQLWRSRLRGLHEGKAPEELSPPIAFSDDLPVIEDEQKVDLGRWLSDLLVERNYKRWPQHMDILKCALKNAFPQMSMEPTTARVGDFIYLLEGHLLLDKRWERLLLERPKGELCWSVDVVTPV